MNPFFIFALPRSRTCWLANWLTHGNSFCYHDGLRHCAEIADMQSLFTEAAASMAVTHTGDSDSGLALFWRQLLALFPTAKALFVHRPLEDCLLDYCAFFNREPYIGTGPSTPADLRPTFQRLANAMDAASDHWPEGHALGIDYRDLDDPAKAAQVWQFLTGTPFAPLRWELLHSMRLNPIPSKIAVDWPRFARLLATAEPGRAPRSASAVPSLP